MRGDVRASCMGIERAVAQPVMHHSGGESWVVALASAQRLAHRAGVSTWFLKIKCPTPPLLHFPPSMFSLLISDSLLNSPNWLAKAEDPRPDQLPFPVSATLL
jgi:hypothetical protein